MSVPGTSPALLIRSPSVALSASPASAGTTTTATVNSSVSSAPGVSGWVPVSTFSAACLVLIGVILTLIFQQRNFRKTSASNATVAQAAAAAAAAATTSAVAATSAAQSSAAAVEVARKASEQLDDSRKRDLSVQALKWAVEMSGSADAGQRETGNRYLRTFQNARNSHGAPHDPEALFIAVLQQMVAEPAAAYTEGTQHGTGPIVVVEPAPAGPTDSDLQEGGRGTQ